MELPGFMEWPGFSELQGPEGVLGWRAHSANAENIDSGFAGGVSFLGRCAAALATQLRESRGDVRERGYTAGLGRATVT